MKDPNQEGPLPFLDTLVFPGPNNTLVTTVCRKATHTDQYLHWDSNHFHHHLQRDGEEHLSLVMNYKPP